MRLADLRIEGFRGIRKGHIWFSDHTVFIGPNNSGKTTVVEALALLFGRDRLVRELTEHDFYGGNPAPQDRIHLVATITGFTGDATEHPDWFRDDRAVPKWLNRVTRELRGARPSASASEWDLACQVGFMARFDRSSLEVETARYFHDDDAVKDVFSDETWTPLPSKLLREIGLYLVPASRTWERVISFGSELFRRVVASGDGPPAESVLDARDRLRAPDKALEDDPNLEAIVDELNSELAGFFITKPTLQLRLTQTDSLGVLDAVVPHYRHLGQSPSLPARRHGSGLISLQSLLLLLQFGRRRSAAGQGFWMALEEPELHVPPALQRRLVHRIQALSTQTFVSTHSPMVAAMSDPRALQLLRIESGVLASTPLLREALPASTPNPIRRLFQLNRMETIGALMHDAVVVPEGRIDTELIGIVVRAIEAEQSWNSNESCPFASHVGIVPTQDAAVVETYARIAELHPCVGCLVDGDEAGQQYISSLSKQMQQPTVVLSWPKDWEIEDVMGWIAAADEAGVIAALARNMDFAPAKLDELVERLKSKDRSKRGLKQDTVAYEALGEAIASAEKARERARELLDAIAAALLGETTELFVRVARQDTLNLVTFQP